MPQISIIVPIYKGEPYLCRCVDSILEQTFTDFELILVDDGSPDGCPAICDAYAIQDNRIRVIHQENGGLSAARNAGIDWAVANSDSEWLTFVDSDDWIHPETLERLYLAARELKVPVSLCGFQRTSGEAVEISGAIPSAKGWTPEEYYVHDIVTSTVAWGKLYKKDCFQEIRYPVGKIHEDEYVTYRILFSFPQIAVIEAPMYAYYQNPTGIMKSKWTKKKLNALEAHEEQNIFFESHGYEKAYRRQLWFYVRRFRESLLALKKSGEELQPEEIRALRAKFGQVFDKARRAKVIDITSDMDVYCAVHPRLKALWFVLMKLKIARSKVLRIIFSEADVDKIKKFLKSGGWADE